MVPAVVLQLKRTLPAVLAATLLAGGAAASSAAAPERPPKAPPERTAGLETLLQDDAQVLHRTPEQVRASMAKLRAIGVDRLRVTANWSVVTRDADSETRPADFDAADPAAYEQARWASLDQAVRFADEAGLRVMIDIAFWAPRWASADPEGERGRTDIDPQEFGAFSAAVARRYSGRFVVPGNAAPVEPNEDEQVLDEFFGGPSSEPPPPSSPLAEPLPRVDVFTLWNEPNHTGFVRPQWVRDASGEFRPRSPAIYRAMVDAGYPAVKAVDPEATVLVGATSGSGAYRRKGTGSVPPLRFLRELACVDEQLRPLTTGRCAGFKRLPGDGWSHHPYSMKNTPDMPSGPNQVDDVPMAELPRLVRALDALADAGRIAPALRDVWVTEYGYETNPPSTLSRFGPGDQARFLPWGEYLAWRLPEVKSFAQFLLRDLPPGRERVGSSLKRPFGEWYSGLEFADGRPKLAMESFQAGLFAQRLNRGQLRLWARLRLGGGPRTVTVETRRRAGAPWVPMVTSTPAGDGRGRSFVADGRGVLHRRARVSRLRSTRYRLRIADGAGVRFSPSVRAVATRSARPVRPARAPRRR